MLNYGYTLVLSQTQSQTSHSLFDILPLGVYNVMPSIFPLTDFRATVCASIEDNQYRCAPATQVGSNTKCLFACYAKGTQRVIRAVDSRLESRFGDSRLGVSTPVSLGLDSGLATPLENRRE